MKQDKLVETLAINTGNMIASLNLQIAELQTAHKAQDQSTEKLKTENDKLKIENEILRKKVNTFESSTNNTDNRKKHSSN